MRRQRRGGVSHGGGRTPAGARAWRPALASPPPSHVGAAEFAVRAQCRILLPERLLASPLPQPTAAGCAMLPSQSTHAQSSSSTANKQRAPVTLIYTRHSACRVLRPRGRVLRPQGRLVGGLPAFRTSSACSSACASACSSQASDCSGPWCRTHTRPKRTVHSAVWPGVKCRRFDVT